MAVANQTTPHLDHYRLSGLITEGEFKALYRGEDLQIGEPAAIAVLREEYAADHAFRESYRRRSAVLAQVRHPNISPIADTGLTGAGLPYAAGSLVEGYPLRDRLARLRQQRSTAHVTYALTLIRQVAAGMELAEKLELAHFRLTPAHIFLKNITLKAEDSVLVTDLDLPANVGAPAPEVDQPYLSPEQRAGKNPTSASHVYSLGAILFELLAGEPPPERVPWRSRVTRWLGGAAPLAAARPELSAETYALVERALHKNPRRRFGSVSAFRNALDGALEAEEVRIHTGQYEAVPRTGRPLFLLPLILLLLCMGLAFAAQQVLPILPATAPPRAALTMDAANEAVAVMPPSPSATVLPPSPTPVPPSPVPAAARDTATPRPSPTPMPSVTPRPTATSSPTATTPAEPGTLAPPTFRVEVSSANLRRGPGTNYEVSGYVLRGETVIVLARNEGDFAWYNVRTADGRIGWLAADIGAPTGPDGLASVELAATIPVPPTPTPTPTTTPTSTPTPTATLLPPGGSGGGGGSDGGGGGQPPAPRPTPTPPF